MSALNFAPVLDLVAEVKRYGGRLRVVGEGCKVTAPAPLPDRLMDALRAAKPAVRAYCLADLAASEITRLDCPISAADLLLCLSPSDQPNPQLITPEGLAALARVVHARLHRERGLIPPGWTQPAECRRCGPVVLWVGAPPTIEGCPWCFNRVAGRPIPSFA